MSAFSVARFTETDCTPSSRPTTFSIRAVHEAHVMPSTGKVTRRAVEVSAMPYPAPTTAFVTSSREARRSSNCTFSRSVARFTLARDTPGILPTTFSIRAEHEAHVIPVTVSSCCFIASPSKPRCS